MKIPFKQKFAESGAELVRKAGYGRIYDSRQDQYSYVKRIGRDHFPRFHMYINSEDPLELSLHLDQKSASYEGTTAHSGDYDSEVVRAESLRIWNSIMGISSDTPTMELDAENDDTTQEPHLPEHKDDDSLDDGFAELGGMRF